MVHSSRRKHHLRPEAEEFVPMRACLAHESVANACQQLQADAKEFVPAAMRTADSVGSGMAFGDEAGSTEISCLNAYAYEFVPVAKRTTLMIRNLPNNLL
ncbi:hypothetical protein GOP47_0008806 [Adiantum capillus-veneris]|uniref:Uncharacterized protein n=1 Tax=Adiantum capillus-veneris TaxID=13818 RepID=A0A9D4UZ18_ADICA|nr:hypothetical protein GOP47_0008806 [Adiantum capillus-veneris]